MPSTKYSAEQQQQMLEHVRSSIARGLDHTLPVAPSIEPWQQDERAVFVTLYRKGVLRGCIGNLRAYRSLWEELKHNAKAAAFDDPRFPPLRREELDDTDIHISILTLPQQIHVASKDDLLHTLRPGIDGLVLEEGESRATFLPQVWRQLPEPKQFLEHLWHKAGLVPDYWSDTMLFSVYQVMEIKAHGE